MYILRAPIYNIFLSTIGSMKFLYGELQVVSSQKGFKKALYNNMNYALNMHRWQEMYNFCGISTVLSLIGFFLI